MSTMRKARELSPRDKGRTIEGIDIENTLFVGELLGGVCPTKADATCVELHINHQTFLVPLDQDLKVTGKVVAPVWPS